MYDNRRPRIVHSPPAFDIHQIIKEAQIRWLKPVEVIEILQNYQIFRLNPVPANKPPSGSLFLFDRKTLRFFRKDGHNWRKKKDGKTVREAHERLKAGSVDVLHCYYAHGEDNPNFQRRSYWMLEGAYEHIVLVHYREVSEGSRPSVLRSPIQDSSSSQGFSGINRDLTDLASISRTNVVVPPAVISSPGYSELEVTGPYKSPESGDPIGIPDDGIDSQDEVEDASSVGLEETTNPLLQQLWTVDDSSNMANEILMQHDALAKFPENQGLPNVSTSMGIVNAVPDGQQHVQSGYTLNLSGCNALLETFRGALAAQTSAEYFKGASDWPVKLGQGTEKGKEKTYLDSLPSFGSFHPLHYANNGKQDLACVGRDVKVCKEEQDQKASQLKGNGMNIEEQQMDVDLQHPRCHGDSNIRKQPSRIFELQDAECHVGQGGNEHLKKLDSFGRWMSREIGDDSQSSFLSGSTDRGACWTPIEDQFDEISSLSNQIQLDTGPTPSLSQDQQFTIIEFSPDWGFATEETKVVIVGSFLKGSNSFTENTWCCMFGEIEVPAEVIQDGVLRCKAPPHNSGTVPFYVTLGDRLACSEIREFHYRVHNSGASGHLIQSSLFTSFQQEDMQLQLRFLRILMGSGNTDDKLPEDTELDNALQTSAYDFKECVIQVLLKKRLQEWISNAITGHGQIISTLDNKGQSLLHIVAALGYDWAISPLLAAGVGVNFRDVQGWTALHWAAFRGREKVVVALLAAEAGPGLLTDPTPRHPNGQTPADLAASSGHGGIAGYLAEMSLTSHLSSLTLKEKATNEIDNFSAVLAGEKAVEYVSEKGDILENSRDNDESSLQESLRAVRNAARAAALIHATFRQESFRRRQETTDTTYDSDYGMSRRDMKSMLLQQKALHHRKEHSAAVQIQRKFRSWKGRRDFLVLRQRVVKIQAHFRGHQVRKKFRRLLWSVGILEKAVLRWRRKRVGLRGFHVETSSAETVGNGQSSEEEDVLKAGRKQKEAAIQKAVTRVQAMVRCHLARAQYQRLLKAQQQALNGVIGKMHQMNSSLSEPVDNDQEMTTESSMLEVRR